MLTSGNIEANPLQGIVPCGLKWDGIAVGFEEIGCGFLDMIAGLNDVSVDVMAVC